MRLYPQHFHTYIRRYKPCILIFTQVNKAGDGVWVVLHLYKQGIPLCALINKYLTALAPKFPTTKFLRSISTTWCPFYETPFRPFAMFDL
jgi:hypothetical protein